MRYPYYTQHPTFSKYNRGIPMEKEKKVTVIPATVTPSKADKIVVIYARESFNSSEQLRALAS